MKTIEAHKKSLIDIISEINNENILDTIDIFLANLTSSNQINTTSELQRKSISEGINDIKTGNSFSEEEIDNLDLKWLNEK